MIQVQEQVAEKGRASLDLSRLLEDMQAGFGRRAAVGRPAMEVLVLGLAGADGLGGERAAEALRRGFRPWSKLLTTAPELVAAALRPVEPNLGRALAKAERLITTVRRLASRSGGLSLDFLAEMKAQDAYAWLEDALGLSPPLIAQVLSASPILHRVAHPAPAAIRVLERLGLSPAGADPLRAGRDLAEVAPLAWTGTDLAELSSLLQALGEGLCHRERPDCGVCPVASRCPSTTVKAGLGRGGDAARPLAYLRRRIARMEGDSRSAPMTGLRLGGAMFSQETFPHGLPFGVHQACPASPVQGASPLILAIAAAVALERRDGEQRDQEALARESPALFQRRRAKPLVREPPSAAVRLLMVQEIDALREYGEPYPPGLLALGVDPATTAFVTVNSGAEVLRVVEEALKLRAAPVLVAELRKGEGVVDLAVTRRLNIVARRAGAILFLITPDLSNTSAALTRWRVGAAPSRSAFASFGFGRRLIGPPAFTLDLVRNRLGLTGAWTVEWDLHEQRFRTLESSAKPRLGAHPPLPAPHLPPPVDGQAVAYGRAVA